jgi:hypothetical protein
MRNAASRAPTSAQYPGGVSFCFAFHNPDRRGCQFLQHVTCLPQVLARRIGVQSGTRDLEPLRNYKGSGSSTGDPTPQTTTGSS